MKEKFLEVMDFNEGLATSSRDRADRIANFEERLAGFMKGYMTWTPAKRMLFLEEAGAETISDFTVLFANVLDRMLLPKYKSQSPDWRQYIKTGINRDFRPSRGIGLWGLRGALDPRTNRGEYKEKALNDGQISIAVSPFGNQYPVGWECFINDDLGALSAVADDFVQSALRTEWREATKLFCSSSGPHSSLFGAIIAHPIDGAATTNKGTLAFNGTNLGTVFQLMRSQRDADGEPIIITRFHVVVPPALEVSLYQALNTAALIAVGLSSTSVKEVQTSANVVAQNFNVVGHVNPYLPIIDTSGNEEGTWYVFADPGTDGPSAQLNFLQGHEVPEVLMKGSNKVSLGGGTVSAMEGDFETDKVRFRARHIMGGTQVDPRMCYAQVHA
jgi:hypothetical protein